MTIKVSLYLSHAPQLPQLLQPQIRHPQRRGITAGGGRKRASHPGPHRHQQYIGWHGFPSDGAPQRHPSCRGGGF